MAATSMGLALTFSVWIFFRVTGEAGLLEWSVHRHWRLLSIRYPPTQARPSIPISYVMQGTSHDGELIAESERCILTARHSC